MTRRFLLLLAAILLLMGSGAAQTRRKQIKTRQAKSGVTDIRRIDFLNFAYQSSLCSEVFGVGRMVKVSKGKFENNDSYYRVVDNKIIYADVTADGREDAIVHIICGSPAGNFSDSEIFIYTLENGRAKLFAELDDKDLERDYLRYYPSGFFWGITYRGVKVRDGQLIIESYAEGPHAGPEYVVTFNYKPSGASLALSGKPQRRRANLR